MIDKQRREKVSKGTGKKFIQQKHNRSKDENCMR